MTLNRTSNRTVLCWARLRLGIHTLENVGRHVVGLMLSLLFATCNHAAPLAMPDSETATGNRGTGTHVSIEDTMTATFSVPDTDTGRGTGDSDRLAVDTETGMDSSTASSTGWTDQWTAGDTHTSVAVAYTPAGMSMAYMYRQTGDWRLFDASSLHVDTLPDGRIAVSGTTADSVDWGLADVTDTDGNPVPVPFIQVISPNGDTAYTWVYPNSPGPAYTTVDGNGRLIWVGDLGSGYGDAVTLGGMTITNEPAYFYYARIDVSTGRATALAVVPRQDLSSAQDQFDHFCVTGDSAGNLYVGGGTGNSNLKAAVMRIDVEGTTEWLVSWLSCENTAYFGDLAVVSPDALVGVGGFDCALVVSEEREIRSEYRLGERYTYDGFIGLVSTANGATLGAKRMGGLDWDQLMAVDVAQDGAVRAAGYIDGDAQIDHVSLPGASSRTVVAVEVSATGAVAWATVLHGGLWINDTVIDAQNRSHLVGQSPSTSTSPVAESLIVALDEVGRPMAMETLAFGAGLAEDVTIDGNGGVWVTGKYKDEIVGPDGQTVSPSPSGSYLIRFELVAQ